MIFATAAPYCQFICLAQSWCGFARIQYFGIGPGNSPDKLVGKAGYAAHAPQKVEGGALGGEQAAGRTGKGGKDLAILYEVAFLREGLKLHLGIYREKDGLRHIQPGNDSGLFGNNLPGHLRSGRQDAVAGGISRADVFGKSLLNGL
jgi:hypothetical protein